MPLGSKWTPSIGSQFYIELYNEIFKRHLPQVSDPGSSDLFFVYIGLARFQAPK